MGGVRRIFGGGRRSSPPPPPPPRNIRNAYGRSFDLDNTEQRAEYDDFREREIAGEIDSFGNPIEREPPPVPDEASPEVTAARNREARAARRRASSGGRRGTILTGPQGLEEGARGTKKTLLGQ